MFFFMNGRNFKNENKAKLIVRLISNKYYKLSYTKSKITLAYSTTEKNVKKFDVSLSII